MRLDFSGERVLAVTAHPDDAELLCAGTLARAKADGAAIAVCVLCQGDKGQPDPPLPDLPAVRRAETQAALELLGAEAWFGDALDGELMDHPETRREVIETFRRFRPTLVLAHSAADYHPDHRAAGELADAASWLAASPGWRTPSPPVGRPPAVWRMDTVNMSGFEPELYVDVSEHVELKRRMLACHRSQLQRAGAEAFSPLEPLMLRQCAARGAQAGVAAAEAFQTHRGWKRARAW